MTSSESAKSWFLHKFWTKCHLVVFNLSFFVSSDALYKKVHFDGAMDQKCADISISCPSDFWRRHSDVVWRWHIESQSFLVLYHFSSWCLASKLEVNLLSYGKDMTCQFCCFLDPSNKIDEVTTPVFPQCVRNVFSRLYFNLETHMKSF